MKLAAGSSSSIDFIKAIFLLKPWHKPASIFSLPFHDQQLVLDSPVVQIPAPIDECILIQDRISAFANKD